MKGPRRMMRHPPLGPGEENDSFDILWVHRSDENMIRHPHCVDLDLEQLWVTKPSRRSLEWTLKCCTHSMMALCMAYCCTSIGQMMSSF